MGDHNSSQRVVLASLIAGIFLCVHFLATFPTPFSTWGVNMLAFYPDWVSFAFLGCGAVFLVPYSRQVLLDFWARWGKELDCWAPTPRALFCRMGLIASGGALFVALSSATHFLGDGYLYTRDLPAEFFNGAMRVDNEPLAFYLISALYRWGIPWDMTPETVYRCYSYASGVLYLLLTFPLARRLGKSLAQRWIALGCLVTPGYMQLFFGYVETYALLVPVVALYLLCGLQALRGSRPLWLPALVLGLGVPLHFSLVALGPSLLVLALLVSRNERSEQFDPYARINVNPWQNSLKNLTLASLAPLLSIVVILRLGLDPIDYWVGLEDHNTLPLLDEPGFFEAYRVLSWQHLVDFLNELLLVAPVAAMAILLGWGKRAKAGGGQHLFLLSAWFFALVLVFTVNPEIGAARDWDVLALPGLPLVLWAVWRLLERDWVPRQLGHVGLAILGVAALHSLAWVGLNARPAAAEARFVHILEHSPMSQLGRAYGWDTLGGYYGQRPERAPQALYAYQQAMAADGTNPRYCYAAGIKSIELGDHQAAIGYLEKAIELKPTFVEAYNNVAIAYVQVGRRDAAVERWVQAVALNPHFLLGHSNLGHIYYQSGEWDQAAYHWEQTVALRTDFVPGHFYAGLAQYHLGRHAEVVRHWDRVLAVGWDNVDSYVEMARALRSLGEVERAKDCVSRALELSPDYQAAVELESALEQTAVDLDDLEDLENPLDLENIED